MNKVLVVVFIMVLVFSAILTATAAETIAGTLISISWDSRALTIKDGVLSRKITISPTTKILRGQVGKAQQEVSLRELAPGDRILAAIDSDKTVTSIRASYAVITGIVDRTVDRKIVLKQGKAVFVHKSGQIALATGKNGSMSDIKPGAFIICRLEPISKDCWTVVVSSVSQGTTAVKPVAPKPAPAVIPVVPKPVPTKATPPVSSSGPVIKGVLVQGSPDVRAGDVLAIELTGTPKGVAKAEIRGVAGPVDLKEVSPGLYKGSLPIRSTAQVTSALVTGYLTLNSKSALPVQAKNRLSLNAPARKRLPAPVKMPRVDMSKPPVAPVIVPVAPKPPEVRPISVTYPDNFSTVLDAINVKGLANPSDRVNVHISYNNGKTGALIISGVVIAQDVAVTKEGTFKFGPIALSGILQTRGLQFTVVVSYPDHPERAVEARIIYGRK